MSELLIDPIDCYLPYLPPVLNLISLPSDRSYLLKQNQLRIGARSFLTPELL